MVCISRPFKKCEESTYDWYYFKGNEYCKKCLKKIKSDWEKAHGF